MRTSDRPPADHCTCDCAFGFVVLSKAYPRARVFKFRFTFSRNFPQICTTLGQHPYGTKDRKSKLSGAAASHPRLLASRLHARTSKYCCPCLVLHLVGCRFCDFRVPFFHISWCRFYTFGDTTLARNLAFPMEKARFRPPNSVPILVDFVIPDPAKPADHRRILVPPIREKKIAAGQIWITYSQESLISTAAPTPRCDHAYAHDPAGGLRVLRKSGSNLWKISRDCDLAIASARGHVSQEIIAKKICAGCVLTLQKARTRPRKTQEHGWRAC